MSAAGSVIPGMLPDPPLRIHAPDCLVWSAAIHVGSSGMLVCPRNIPGPSGECPEMQLDIPGTPGDVPPLHILRRHVWQLLSLSSQPVLTSFERWLRTFEDWTGAITLYASKAGAVMI